MDRRDCDLELSLQLGTTTNIDSTRSSRYIFVYIADKSQFNLSL